MVKTDSVKEPVERVTREETVEAMQKLRSEETTGPSEVSVNMIVASVEVVSARINR